ncbi:MAG TPA: type II toxin-antitoxin system prevent-host-death family antitoxin [Solirubrobacterales bacterium]|nr:type II toxin-antitoxin system prevent-host-death family antitoxin [Solirubrobacterales bacterium]
MSDTVGIRELKNNLSQIIERVEAGEPITVTRRGQPVARIVSTTRSPRMAELIAKGIVRPGNGSRHLPKPIKLQGSGKTAAEYVSEGRR